MQKQIPKYQIKQNLLHAIGNHKECSRLVCALKNNEDFNTVVQVVSETIRMIPQFEKRCWGNLVPKTIKDLGKEKVYFYKPISLRSEINWTILGIKRHIDIIKKFIEHRKIYEHQVLLGEYSKALETLNTVEKEIGVSIWLYESKFVVYEMMGAQDKSIMLISQINEAKQGKDEDNGYVTLLLYYLWNRAKKDLSAIKYDEDLFSTFKRNRTDFQKDTYNYHLFRLNYYMHYNIEDPAIPLVMEATNSIIDRYIVLIQVLQSAYIKGDNVDLIVSRSQYLYKLTNDNTLISFLHLKQNQTPIHTDYFDKKYIYIIDSYYKGDYRDVMVKCQTYIKENTANFDVIKFYCYSLLFEGNGYSPLYSDSSSPINQISKKIYDSISEKDNSASLYNLYQLNKNLYSFSVAAGLDYFIKDENNTIKSNHLRLLSLKYFDPLFSAIFEEEGETLQYLNNGLKNIGSSISIEHQIRRVKKEMTPQSIIVDYITEEDNAKILFLNQEYEQSYNSWIAILRKNNHNNPISQTAIKFAFDCLIKLEKYQEAITLFVNEYIENPISIKKTDVTSFIQLLKKQKYKNIKRTIELPVFVGLNSPKDTDKSFILQSFCDYYDVKRTSELFDLITGCDIEKVETFFFVVVSEDILRHCVYINSTQESLEEKQKILSFLINLKTENEPIYKKMADEVLEELIVYTGTKKMDESKIFANDQAIIKYELSDIEGLYDSFNVQYNLLETGTTFLYVDTTSLTDNEAIDGAILKANVKYTDNAIYQVAYALYDTIRDRFLFSKFGLGTYLSTRIRHGVLEGELRSDFVTHNLILNKSNDKYVENPYWLQTYGLDRTTNEELNRMLADFSERIDALISNFKSEVLQIKTSKTDKGFFDYYIDSETLSLEALKIAWRSKNSQDFCQLVIKNLWEITERNLSNIRNYIKCELAEKFHNLFDELMTKVSALKSEHFHNDIITCISDVRASFSQKLLKINGWFHIQESKFEDFNLQDLINIVWESTRKFYPKVNLECQLNIQGANLTIKALYGIHFSDILRIFLTNMFKYSSNNSYSNVINSQIRTTISDNTLFLTFENDINQNGDELNQKFKSLMDSQGRLQIEGGSGLVKAQKIVQYDLDDVNNYVNIKAEDQKCIAVVKINLQNLVAL
jgi:hypothetical protein